LLDGELFEVLVKELHLRHHAVHLTEKSSFIFFSNQQVKQLFEVRQLTNQLENSAKVLGLACGLHKTVSLESVDK